MAIAFITGDVKQSVTSSLNTTGANFIVLVTGGDPSRSPSDSKSNSWTPLTEVKNGSDTAAQLWYCVNPTVGSGHTFDANQSYAIIGAAAFSGVHAVPFDVENGGSTAAATSKQGGSVTPSENNELVITGICNGNATTGLGVNSSFNLVAAVDAVTFVTYGGGLAYKIQTALSAEDPAWSWSGTATASVVNATFKSSGTAVNATPGTGDLVITGYPPTIQTPRTMLPGTGVLQITGYAPTVQTPVTVLPGVGMLQITGYAPTITTSGLSLQPGTGQLQLIGYAPTITVRKFITDTGDNRQDYQSILPTLSTLNDNRSEMQGNTTSSITDNRLSYQGNHKTLEDNRQDYQDNF